MTRAEEAPMSEGPTPLQIFGAYAAAFEETYKDDDWKRLEPFFAADAVYSVVNLGPVTCSIRGRDAILAGLRKSIDGFDRRFDSRAVEILTGPEEDGSNVRAGWRVTYTCPGHPNAVISAYSVARVADGRIVELFDVYDAGVTESFGEWLRATGVTVDPSYVGDVG
jgi:hypothetical protein